MKNKLTHIGICSIHNKGFIHDSLTAILCTVRKHNIVMCERIVSEYSHCTRCYRSYMSDTKLEYPILLWDPSWGIALPLLFSIITLTISGVAFYYAMA